MRQYSELGLGRAPTRSDNMAPDLRSAESANSKHGVSKEVTR